MVDRRITTALPLDQAAAKLGLTTDDLHEQWRSGKIPGFSRDGQVFICLTERAAAGSSRSAPDAAASVDQGGLSTIVDMQREELDRLRGEVDRLNERTDFLLKMQEREQVLRQQLQGTIDRMVERLGTPTAPAAPASADTGLLTSRLYEVENRFSLLKSAVLQLLTVIERRSA